MVRSFRVRGIVGVAAALALAFGTAVPVHADELVPDGGPQSVATAPPAADPAPTAAPAPTPGPPPSPAPTSAPLEGEDPPSATQPPAETLAPPAEMSSRSETRQSTEMSATVADPVIQAFGTGVHRLAGADRYETAVAISKRFGPNVPVLHVATGLNFPDGLTAAAAAARSGGPLLLTRTDALPEVVRAEIVRLAPARIVVVGSDAVVSQAVFDQLATLAPTITRLGGTDRYQTGELVVDDAFGAATEAFVATGADFPDALAASAAAGAIGAPVFLVEGLAQSARQTTVAAMKALGVKTVRIAGSAGAVSEGIAKQLAGEGFTVLRHQGADRYLTAAAINEAVFRSTSSAVGSAFLATGSDFADALSGAALAGAIGSPLYLTRATCIPHPAWTALREMAPPARVLLGSAAVVGDAVAEDTACGTDWAKPANGRITSSFGPREPICTSGGCTSSFHGGTDLATGCNAPIYAASSGKVSTAGWVGTYGNFIKIAHASSIDTGYAHLVDGGIRVKVGQTVSVGQLIGYSGTTGASTGCHLHFEVYQAGTRIDPVPFLSARGVTLG
ncbi:MULTISPECIES: cell wall-binding repeat-containing protein [unclassified Agromyces]|uniref:cell wall-binding repeat-containing protein n=1 Tax=unclassified Agromyces TaxID=2639701 RepID=UPI0030146580